MSENALVRVERVCAELAITGPPITFTAVAEHAHIGRATLYRDKQLRAVVEALAVTVTRHEEQLRRLRRNPPSRL